MHDIIDIVKKKYCVFRSCLLYDAQCFLFADFYNLTKNQFKSLAILATDTHKFQRYDKGAIRVVRATERKIL